MKFSPTLAVSMRTMKPQFFLWLDAALLFQAKAAPQERHVGSRADLTPASLPKVMQWITTWRIKS